MDERIKAYDVKMTKSYNNLLEEFGAIRAGRANPHVLDRITVEYYGTPTPLQQVGNVTVPEPRMIQIQPWDASLIKEICKAIQTSDLGINPNTEYWVNTGMLQCGIPAFLHTGGFVYEYSTTCSNHSGRQRTLGKEQRDAA